MTGSRTLDVGQKVYYDSIREGAIKGVIVGEDVSIWGTRYIDIKVTGRSSRVYPRGYVLTVHDTSSSVRAR